MSSEQMVVTRVAIITCARAGFLIYAMFGFLGAVLMIVVPVVSAALGLEAADPLSGMLLGSVSIVVLPALYGLLGCISAVVGGLLYNLASRWVGGIAVEVDTQGDVDAGGAELT